MDLQHNSTQSSKQNKNSYSFLIKDFMHFSSTTLKTFTFYGLKSACVVVVNSGPTPDEKENLESEDKNDVNETNLDDPTETPRTRESNSRISKISRQTL